MAWKVENDWRSQEDGPTTPGRRRRAATPQSAAAPLRPAFFVVAATGAALPVTAWNCSASRCRPSVHGRPESLADGQLGNISQQVKGQEEALGLRLIIGSQTTMVPNVYDPSELRSDVNGKVVRYLHDEGTEIAAGDAYIELEAMKMIMALKSSEAGKVSHALSAGSIVSAGELLARLELKDPSKVKKILPFEGEFSLGVNVEQEIEVPRDELLALLDGYCTDQKGPQTVAQMFAGDAR
ncbi:Acetyl-CoA carboxylase 2 (ACC-beta) [Durusdinium trenchii]|uniref:Acetyl-CoA carboxylase 2 (ACC-beta) n=1 Tax=Durusdinium trenchii TaxID=1381693 RepID=A0ABP0QYJ1_9DINO